MTNARRLGMGQKGMNDNGARDAFASSPGYVFLNITFVLLY